MFFTEPRARATAESDTICAIIEARLMGLRRTATRENAVRYRSLNPSCSPLEHMNSKLPSGRAHAAQVLTALGSPMMTR